MTDCKNCKWWYKAEEQYVYGECHRLPPTPDFDFSITPSKWGEGGSGTISRRAKPIYPNTHETDWCGEFREARS